ncbi:MAG: hypothetical protein JXA77_00140 [Bacteroidales bacterium]|nr:hypothetical protein [Bacteroidales bacterium]MBN2821251.1 hypothetical protein [Bacteroidales bacterium]
MKVLYTVLFMFILSVSVNAQTKSQIKELNIKSTSVWSYDYSTGKEVKKLDQVEKFNNRGQVIQLIDYDKNGKQKERITYSYNDNGDITEEKYYDETDKIAKAYKYTYEDQLKKTKEKYDDKGNLIWKKVYVYEM